MLQKVEKIKFPEQPAISKSARNLLKMLLERRPGKPRLTKSSEIKMHKWFSKPIKDHLPVCARPSAGRCSGSSRYFGEGFDGGTVLIVVGVGGGGVSHLFALSAILCALLRFQASQLGAHSQPDSTHRS